VGEAYIYALVDPNTDEVRYVGKSDDPERRLREHFNQESTNKTCWLDALQELGQSPTVTVLETVEDGIPWRRREEFWFKYGIQHGWNLTNDPMELKRNQGSDNVKLSIVGLTEEEKNRIKAACAGRGEYVSEVGRRLLLDYAEEWERVAQHPHGGAQGVGDG